MTIAITHGTSGVSVPGATIIGVVTSADGTGVLTFLRKGVFALKAGRSDSLRFNAIAVAVFLNCSRRNCHSLSSALSNIVGREKELKHDRLSGAKTCIFFQIEGLVCQMSARQERFVT